MAVCPAFDPSLIHAADAADLLEKLVTSADARVLAADDFFVNEAVLTGESLPSEKRPATLARNTSLALRTNCVFMGTNARSGIARVLIVTTGSDTVYGQIAAHLSMRPAATEFERGLRHFGQMLAHLMTVLVLGIFAVNVAYDRPVAESLLFAVALAVGLAPELLPAIVSITWPRPWD